MPLMPPLIDAMITFYAAVVIRAAFFTTLAGARLLPLLLFDYAPRAACASDADICRGE